MFALYLLTGLLGLFLMGLYLSIVPGALDSTSTAILGTFVIGQAYVLCRIAIRCLFYAGEAALTAPLPDASLVDIAGECRVSVPVVALDTDFRRDLGAFDATMVVVGSMIGSGIFLVSADMARTLGSPGWLLASWLLTAGLTLAAALSYGELAAMMPRAGGQYVYLREAFNPLLGFLYGWTLFLVIQTGTIAAVTGGVLPLSRRLGADDLRGSLSRCPSPSDGALCRLSLHGATAGDLRDRPSDMDQYPRRAVGEVDSERVHLREDGGCRRPDPPRPARRLERGRGLDELW